MNVETAKIQYLSWLAQAYPLLYGRVVAIAQQKDMERGLSGLEGWLDTLVTAAVAVGGTLMAKKQADQAASLQKKQQAADLAATLLQVNTQRAQSGLPPVDANGRVIPGAQLPVPAALSSAIRTSAASVSNYLPWALGAGVALIGAAVVFRGR